jgi:hypothetical protein
VAILVVDRDGPESIRSTSPPTKRFLQVALLRPVSEEA